MATITDPIMLDSTGQDIKDQISALNTKIQTLNTLLADLGLVSITPISQQDYDALSQAEKLAGVFDIYDAVEPDIDGTKVAYNSNKSVVQAIYDADLREGGTIDGALQIHGNTVVENSGTTDSYLLVGGSTSRGLERIYKSGYYTQIYHQNNLTANRELYLPDKTGTIAIIPSNYDVNFGMFDNITFKSNGTSYTANIMGIKITGKGFSPERWTIFGTVLSGSVLYSRFVMVESTNLEHAVIITPQ